MLQAASASTVSDGRIRNDGKRVQPFEIAVSIEPAGRRECKRA
jgi:hypothetical protein